MAVAMWRGVDAALAPIIGRRGVSALFHRSLNLAAQRHAWLAEVSANTQESPDLAGLGSALARQTRRDAAAAASALFEAFHGLLASLIGPSLTGRLLRTSWVHFSTEPPVQDTPA